MRAVLNPCIDCMTPTHGPRCPVCQARWDAARDYGYPWQTIRAAYIALHPTCEQCGAPTDDIDHRVPLRDGGSHAETNLQALCRSCHRRKTVAETNARLLVV